MSSNNDSMGAVFALLVKFGKIFYIAVGKVTPFIAKTFAKTLKLGKFTLAATSFGAYSLLIDWRFAIALMVCIGVHESGHVWAMRRCGIPTRGFYFLPFVGGVAIAEGSFQDRESHGFIALMGPMWGLGITLVTALIGNMTGEVVFQVAACWMAWVNLINLIPVTPLDGGQLIEVVVGRGGWVTYVAYGIGLLLCAWLGLGLFLFFGLVFLLVRITGPAYWIVWDRFGQWILKAMKKNGESDPTFEARVESNREESHMRRLSDAEYHVRRYFHRELSFVKQAGLVVWYLGLVIGLFELMEVLGGHEAAQGAAEFFRSF